jgi:hypothetical protein
MKVDRIYVNETGKVLGKEWSQGETHVGNRKTGNAHEKKRRQEGNTCGKEGRQETEKHVGKKEDNIKEWKGKEDKKRLEKRGSQRNVHYMIKKYK